VKRAADLGVPVLVTLAAGLVSVSAAIAGGRLIVSGPNWWQSLAARPYLALAEIGVDVGDPGFWILPLVAPLAGTVWAYAMTQGLGRATIRPAVLTGLAFAVLMVFERETPWLLAWFVRPEDGNERAHLLLGLSESVFVVAAVSSSVLTLTLGFGRRAIGVALRAGFAAVAATAIIFAVLDQLGLRVGSGDAAMVKVSIISAGAGAGVGGAVLWRALRRVAARARSGQPT
jgi:hypothetical protein